MTGSQTTTKLETKWIEELSYIEKKCMTSFDDAAKQKIFNEMFPVVDPGRTPLGSSIIVQLRTPKKKLGSIILTNDAVEAQQSTETVGRVVAIGPMAFNLYGYESFPSIPEGEWYGVGDIVTVPMYGATRWKVDFKDADGMDNHAIFVVRSARDVTGFIHADPTEANTFASF